MKKRIYSRGFHVEFGSLASGRSTKTEIKKKTGFPGDNNTLGGSQAENLGKVETDETVFATAIGVNNHLFLKPLLIISAAESLSKQAEYTKHFAGEKPSSTSLSKGLGQMPSTSQKSGKMGKYRDVLTSDPIEDILEIILLILGILGIILGSDSIGGGGWGGGRGGYFDWTAFWAISSAVIAAAGLVAAIALTGGVSPGIYTGILIMPFTVLGLPAGVIGLVKSIRDYYDVGKYLSIAALAMLAVMWIIGLV